MWWKTFLEINFCRNFSLDFCHIDQNSSPGRKPEGAGKILVKMIKISFPISPTSIRNSSLAALWHRMSSACNWLCVLRPNAQTSGLEATCICKIVGGMRHLIASGNSTKFKNAEENLSYNVLAAICLYSGTKVMAFWKFGF